MSFRDRIDDLGSELQNERADAAVLYPGPNTQYVAGIYGEPLDRHFLLVVPRGGEPWIVTPRKALDQIEAESPVDDIRVLESNDPGAVARRLAEEVSPAVDRLLLDDRTPYSVVEPLQAKIDATIDPAGQLMTGLRIRKADDEVEKLERSAAVADRVSKEIRAMGEEVIGMTEREVADEIRGRLHAQGTTRLSFPVVVASGPNAARPYLRHGDRRIQAGEPVILDFGGFLDEYASDQTRTVVFGGEPPEGFEAAYEAVRAAQDAGVDAVEPGVTAEAVQEATYDVVRERGFADQIVHGTGHGVGLEAHEAPSIAEGNERELEPGMVFSVEPGIYFEDEFGVRVEDVVVVTADGCERLNHSPRTWEPL